MIVNLLVKPLDDDGITISESGSALIDASMESLTPLVRLSFRRSRSVFSPLMALALVKPPAGLAPDADADVDVDADAVADADADMEPDVIAESGPGLELVMLEVSAALSLGGDLPLWLVSLSIQSAGVGGTGPKVVTPLGGALRVGGETMGSDPDDRWELCERLDDGGGPGGGGGSGMPGSHRTCDEDRDLAEVGVAMAPVEAARRVAGGTPCESSGLGL